MKSRKGVADIVVSSLLSIIFFLGSNVYKSYTAQKETAKAQTEYKKLEEHRKLVKLRNNFCSIPNPTVDELNMCIKLQALSLTDE
jgi:hypothetical protein